MAEIALGAVGAAATVAAAELTAASGFAGRHESIHRQEITEIQRNTDNFLGNLQSGDVTRFEEKEFWDTRDKCVQGHPQSSKRGLIQCVWSARAVQHGDEYYESIESYKEMSWINIVAKLQKKKEVRKEKCATRRLNQSLRSLNEVRFSGYARQDFRLEYPAM
jgi:hypothetical protein